jgi:hypothetical protein
MLELTRRQAAEVQVRRERRRARLRKCVALLVVAVDAVGQERVETRSARALAAGRRIVERLSEAERLQRRNPAGPDARG